LNQEIDIVALQKGDEKTYQELVKVFAKPIFNTCFYILQNKEEAEDVTQDIFVTVYQSISFFKGDSKLSTWIYRIALNKCNELLRFKKRKKRFGIHIPIFGSSIEIKTEAPDEILHQNERRKVLFKAIAKLPENQQIAYTLYNMEELSYQEIAESMNLSLSAIESLIFRAKQNLRKSLSEFYKINEL
jgi:RNA polymerase sigma-70 factor (ECF subfamily)